MALKSVAAFIIGLFFAAMALLRLAFQYIFNPTMFRRVERQAPACLTDKRYGEHGYVTTASNIKFHYVSKGDDNKPLMLFVHGFPEFWYSWRHQLAGVDLTNYRLVALDLRGYGDSDKPQGLQHYKINLLVKDVKEFIEALGYSSCVLVAHDWGALLAWRVAHEYSQVVDKLVILNGPHPSGYMKFVAKSWEQKKKSWYVAFFQVPYVPELMIQANDFKAIDVTFRSKHMGVKKEGCFTDEDIEAFKYTLGQPGALTPPLNYYRNVLSKYQPIGTWKRKISCPVLVIWGMEDNALDPGNLDYMAEYVDDLTIRKITGASHWVQQEEVSLVNSYIKEFVNKM